MDTTSSNFIQALKEKKASEEKSSDTCPSCGYCKHCGRGGHQAAPYYPYYPMPYYSTWYGNTGGYVDSDGNQVTYTTSAGDPTWQMNSSGTKL